MLADCPDEFGWGLSTLSLQRPVRELEEIRGPKLPPCTIDNGAAQALGEFAPRKCNQYSEQPKISVQFVVYSGYSNLIRMQPLWLLWLLSRNDQNSNFYK